jgi:hypothetical protein
VAGADPWAGQVAVTDGKVGVAVGVVDLGSILSISFGLNVCIYLQVKFNLGLHQV